PQLAESAKTIYLSLAMNEKLDPALRTLAKTGLLLVDLDKMEPQKAEVKIRQALIRQSDDVRLWNALGHISDAQNKWMQSLDAYVQALTIAKKNGNNTAPAINNIGMSLLMQGRYKEAILKFEHAAEIDSDKQLYDNNKRLALILSGQLDKAVEGLSKTRQAQIYNDAGVLAVRLGKYEHAEHLYQKALEISPVWFALAEANLEDLRGLTDREAKVETDQEKLESRMPQKVDKDGKDSTINTDRDEDYPVPRLSPHLMAEKSPTPF
ncbi:MAG TPA: tetratricopeptide repeat protein, partial [Hellea balneolensis]|nr:tetratricopeptide repeat protein [Hellea balneolensis]